MLKVKRGKARNLMIMGTHTGVGKNLLAISLLHALSSQGHCVSPFKGCNIERHYCILPDGAVISQAQAMQCIAAGIHPTARHSPIVAIFNDKFELAVSGFLGPPGPFALLDYLRIVSESIDALLEEFDFLIIEGAGSPVELGVQDIDLANEFVAEHSDAIVLLTTEMCFGGGHAHLLGTLHLMPPRLRRRVQGFILNKVEISGNSSSFWQGVRTLESEAGVPVIGIVPVLPDDRLPGDQTTEDTTFFQLREELGSLSTIAEKVAQHVNLAAIAAMLGLTWRKEALNGWRLSLGSAHP